MPPRRRKVARKSIFDPIHGPITLEGAALGLVGTPEFQRLWGIRQTGFAHLVFPGANHTRLEHSLGTYWVAEQMSVRLGLAPGSARRVALGALLHDLGHAPFSHTLDAPMVEVLGRTHEALSCARIEGTDPDWPPASVEVPGQLERHGVDPRSIANLIDPARSGREGRLMRSVLHGAIDADRIDYLQRDAYYTGVAHGAIDAVRLLDTMRSVHGQIYFAEKGRSAVEGFLVGRALMYSSVYFHKTVRSAEMMAQGAVERLPGYPEAARELFRATDGELLVRLREAGGVSRTLVDGLLERRLYKRAFGWREVTGTVRSRWRRLLASPPRRRALEDRAAEAVKAPPGSVLIDLVGLEPANAPEEDWAQVGILVGERATFPFHRSSPWQALANRPPADWAVSVYAARPYASALARWLARDPSVLP